MEIYKEITEPEATASGWQRFDTFPGVALLAEQMNRDRILLAAASLFANKGYAGASVREITEAAGITKPTLYYYFKNKEDLYIKLMDLAMDTFTEILKQSISRPGSARERLAGLFVDIRQLFSEYLDLLRLVNCTIYSPRGATPDYDIKSRHDQVTTVLSQLLDAAVLEGELREGNKEGVMLLLFGLLRSMQVLLLIETGNASLADKAIRNAVDVIFDGACAPSE